MLPSSSTASPNFIADWESDLPLPPLLYSCVISLYNTVSDRRSASASAAAPLGSRSPEIADMQDDESVYFKDWKETYYSPPAEPDAKSEDVANKKLAYLGELLGNIQALQSTLLDMAVPLSLPAISTELKVSEDIDAKIARISSRLDHYSNLPASFMRLFTPPSTGSAAAWYRSALGTPEFKEGLELLALRLAYFAGEGSSDAESSIFRERYRNLLSRALGWLKDGVLYQLTSYENDFLDRLNRQDSDHVRFKMLVKSCSELNHMIQAHAAWMPCEEIEEGLLEVHAIYFRIRNYGYPLPKSDYAAGLAALKASLAFDVDMYSEFMAAARPKPGQRTRLPNSEALKSWIRKKIEEFGNAFAEQGDQLIYDLLDVYQGLIGMGSKPTTVSPVQLGKGLPP